MTAACNCPACVSLEPLRRVIDRLEAVHTAVETQLALNHPDPMLVTDATTGRYVLLDSLVALVEARAILARATT